MVRRKHRPFRELYYITHVDNVPSIMKKGIYSHERIEKEGLEYTTIYDKGIISRRQKIEAPNGRSLWAFANLFFNARNPMLYRVNCERSVRDIAILGINKDILNCPDVLVTTGNAACAESEIVPVSKKVVSKIAKGTDRVWWHQFDGSKRKIMAECLVPDLVHPQYIKSIYVATYDSRDKVIRDLPVPHGISVIYEPRTFFQPSKRIDLTSRLSVVEGDMFFSRMQTLTASVNCVGIMGKGVASRAKYQFPDVYVYYQDACRKRKLKMGKPALYKRETSLDYQLAEEPETLKKANSETWFLLFATKGHWRDRADIQGIEEGLKWITENYGKEGITSLAISALGCGLGRLEWQNVGPLLVEYLSTLKIPVSIYLPTEKGVPERFLTKEFLLTRRSTMKMSHNR